MEINAEYLRELSKVKAPILETVEYILNICETTAKDGYYYRFFKQYDNVLNLDEMEEVLNILEKKGIQTGGLYKDSISQTYSFKVSWE